MRRLIVLWACTVMFAPTNWFAVIVPGLKMHQYQVIRSYDIGFSYRPGDETLYVTERTAAGKITKTHALLAGQYLGWYCDWTGIENPHGPLDYVEP